MSDSNNPKAVSVLILDKEYVIACPEEERHDLMRSADYLDKKMREIRDAGKIVGSDRIAVMAALNISHELLTQSGPSTGLDADTGLRIKDMQDKIENALFKSQQLEL